MAIPNSLQWEIDRIPRNRKITHGQGLSRFAVDGIEPGAAVFPNTIEKVSHLLSAEDWGSKAVVPWGGRNSLGLPVRLGVLKVNDRAVTFYKMLGFEIDETDTHFLMQQG